MSRTTLANSLTATITTTAGMTTATTQVILIIVLTHSVDIFQCYSAIITTILGTYSLYDKLCVYL